MTTNKYNAKPFWYNPATGEKAARRVSNQCLYFGSQHEFKVYEVLIDVFGLKRVRHQVPFVIKPGTDVFKPLHYVADFTIVSKKSDAVLMIVEAKGFMTPLFKPKMPYFQYFNPALFSRLHLVFSQPPEKRLKVPFYNSVKEFEAFLKGDNFASSKIPTITSA